MGVCAEEYLIVAVSVDFLLHAKRRDDYSAPPLDG